MPASGRDSAVAITIALFIGALAGPPDLLTRGIWALATLLLFLAIRFTIWIFVGSCESSPRRRRVVLMFALIVAVLVVHVAAWSMRVSHRVDRIEAR